MFAPHIPVAHLQRATPSLTNAQPYVLHHPSPHTSVHTSNTRTSTHERTPARSHSRTRIALLQSISEPKSDPAEPPSISSRRTPASHPHQQTARLPYFFYHLLFCNGHKDERRVPPRSFQRSAENEVWTAGPLGHLVPSASFLREGRATHAPLYLLISPSEKPGGAQCRALVRHSRLALARAQVHHRTRAPALLESTFRRFPVLNV